MFDIPIKVEGIERRRRSVGMFHILAGLFLATSSSYFHEHLGYSSFWTILPVYIVAAVSLAYGLFRRRIDEAAKYSRWLRMIQFFLFLLMGVLVLQSVNVVRGVSLLLWSGICLALTFTERHVFSQPTLKIDEDGLSAPVGMAGKKISWGALESVVVRQDYITVSFLNNKYLQFEVKELLTGTEIERINRYCEEKVQGR